MQQGYRDTVVAAACLGLVYLGDALIYVVLPLYPSATDPPRSQNPTPCPDLLSGRPAPVP